MFLRAAGSGRFCARRVLRTVGRADTAETPVSVASACQVRQPKTNSSVVTSLSSASHQAHSYKRKSLSASAISVPSGDIVSHRGGAQSITMRYRGHTNNWPEAAYVDRPGRLGWFQEQGDPRT